MVKRKYCKQEEGARENAGLFQLKDKEKWWGRQISTEHIPVDTRFIVGQVYDWWTLLGISSDQTYNSSFSLDTVLLPPSMTSHMIKNTLILRSLKTVLCAWINHVNDQ